ncbi:apiosidase-like domain-containing protein [Cohnella fermenti]|uniref:DUF4038 domain-containing protein n=1 Tax=Cohnella fermenti TaxID=2565925 RepID=A0A4S4C1B3_9BACL|nr:DUF4038 domain-containing protein [Cohnella fermenti]THF80754.1 DUF4038 domain-containing protein [Cohnella fermenti]
MEGPLLPAGEWTYETVSTDASNAGLHGQAGAFTATAYTGSQSVYKHGFIKPSANNRYLVHDDGTPFFWLGDTHWMGLSGREQLNGSNDAGFASEFKGMIDIRQEQGYTVYATTLFGGDWGDVSPQGTYNEGGPIWYGTGYATAHSSLASPSTGGYSYGSKKAFDGNGGTRWQASSATYPQSIEIDFGSAATIGDIAIEFGQEDTWFYKLEGSEDRIHYDTIADRTATGREGRQFAETAALSSRYVRLTITGADQGSVPSVVELTPYDDQGRALTNAGQMKRMNPAFWANIDERIQYLSNSGFVTALGLDWGRSLEEANEADYLRLARYVVARYGAYPTVWLGAGEYATGCSECWGDVSSYIYDIDPYKRLNFLHNAVWNPDEFRDEDWYQMDYLQAGHGGQKAKTYWLNQYEEQPTKVVIEGEANYENINGIPSRLTRESAWNAMISGSAGFTYGAEGIWQATRDEEDRWQVWNDAPTPWYVAIRKEAGEQMRYLRDFFTSLPWWTLAPDAEAIEWDGAPALTSAAAPYQLSDPAGDLVVAYLPSNGGTYSGTAKQLNPAWIYKAEWYNPRTGQYSTIASGFAPDNDGEWAIPSKPTASEDWALLIRSISNAPAQPTVSLPGGTFSGPMSVELAVYSPTDSVYFTLDGSIPHAQG